MKQQDPSIGQITREDLLEGLRVNRSLLWKWQSTLQYRDKMIQRCHETIKREQEMIGQIEEEAELAPERIKAIEEKIRQQEAELEKLGGGMKKKEKTPASARNELIQALVGRIAKGDKEAIVQLQRLMSK